MAAEDHGASGRLPDVVSSLDASFGRLQGCSGQDANHGHSHLVLQAFGGNNTAGPIDVATAVNAHGGPHGRLAFESETFIAQCVTGDITHTLKAEGFDASEDGTGRGQPIVAHAFDARQSDVIQYGDMTGPLDTDGHYVAATAVRRLTPTECERLQGFPEVRELCRINVWHSSDHRGMLAFAETQNPKSREYVLNADESGLERSADTAGLSSVTNLPGHELPVVLHVLINSGRQEVELRKTGKLILSANNAGKPSASPLSMPIAGFAQIAALTTTIAASGTHHGKAEPQPLTTHFTPLWIGSGSASVSGQEIEELVADAGKFTEAANECLKFTTSPFGQSSQSLDWKLRTSSSCVVAAIISCIPKEIRQASSYSVTVETVSGWTDIPWRGKAASDCPDGPRYKALGNSMAVPCMRWIGRRLDAHCRALTDAKMTTMDVA